MERNDIQKISSETANIPVYKQSAEYAIEHDELPTYRESFRVNMACRDALETAIHESYHDYCLDTGKAAAQGGGKETEMDMTVVWLIAMIVLLAVEAVVPGLISIWFALGALAALVSALLHAPLWLQIVWFLVVSVAALALTRPLAKKYINSRTQPTNADMLIGKECIVRESIDNVRGTGSVSVGGKVWTARTENEGGRLQEGDLAVVVRIEGVKLIVKPMA